MLSDITLCWCQFFSCATTCHNLYESFPHSPCCLWHTVFIVNLFNTSMTFKYGYAARYWRMNVIRYTDHKHTLQASSCHKRCRVCDYEFCMFIMLDDNMAKKRLNILDLFRKWKEHYSECHTALMPKENNDYKCIRFISDWGSMDWAVSVTKGENPKATYNAISTIS